MKRSNLEDHPNELLNILIIKMCAFVSLVTFHEFVLELFFSSSCITISSICSVFRVQKDLLHNHFQTLQNDSLPVRSSVIKYFMKNNSASALNAFMSYV